MGTFTSGTDEDSLHDFCLHQLLFLHLSHPSSLVPLFGRRHCWHCTESSASVHQGGATEQNLKHSANLEGSFQNTTIMQDTGWPPLGGSCTEQKKRLGDLKCTNSQARTTYSLKAYCSKSCQETNW